jgi:TonB family protein
MDFLIAITFRSLVLSAGALVLTAWQRSASARHAIWTLVTAGMLTIAIAAATLPAIPVRVLRPTPQPAVFRAPVELTPVMPAAPLPPASRPFPWIAVYWSGAAISMVRLVIGYVLTRRLVRAATCIDRFEDAIYESGRIAVPLTIAGKILLPSDWRAWDAAKLDAVLIHERTHVRRGDWAIAALAAVNRCVFWFHPLAWWLEAHLRALAEQSCDDASLAHVARETYAQTLVDMAAAVRGTKHRVVWEALAMAKGAEVRMRIDRILDDARPLSRPITRGRWTTMGLAAVPVIFAVALARPAHVQAEQQLAKPPSPAAAPPITHPFDDPELKRARAEVTNLEAEIQRFKRENMGKLPEQFQLNVSQMNNLQMQLGNANETLGRLQQEKLMLETQMVNYQSQLAYYQSLADSPETLLKRIEDLRSQLTAAREMYTDAAPHVKRLQTQIADLEQQRNYSMNPVNGKMIKDIEGSIALLKVQMQGINMNMEEQLKKIQSLNSAVAQYQARIDASPQFEARYANLIQRLKEANDQVDYLTHRPADATAGPRLISRHDPEYTAEARQAGIQGKVELSVTVGADGVLRDIQVVHGLDPGLDKKAIECVKTWRFRPATVKSEAVAAIILVEVPFRLP